MSKVAISGLAHVGIFVRDLEVSKKFYSDLFGMECVEQLTLGSGNETVQIAFMKNGTAALELVQTPDPAFRKEDGATDHVAYTVKDLDAIVGKLKAEGIRFDTEQPVYCAEMFQGTKWIFFRGPDNEKIELAETL